MRIEEVTFTSPVRSGQSGNDRFVAELFLPQDPAGVVVQLPHWKEDNPAAQRLLALALAGRGLAVLLLPLPYQYGRAPDGVGSGSWTLSHDLARTREASFQGVADVVRASLWLERERGFPAARQGVLGTSLGGHVAALAMGLHPDRFRAGVFLLAGADIGGVFLEENGVTDGIRRELVRRGVTSSEARSLVAPLDPGPHGHPDRGGDVLLVAGDADRVVPPERAEALARAWGGARIRWFPGGHYGIVRVLPAVMAEAADHFRARFEAP
jgi:dienelactone hydrolase